MEVSRLNILIEKKRKHLIDMILKKSAPLSDKDIVKISTELDDLISLYIMQTERVELEEHDEKYKADFG